MLVTPSIAAFLTVITLCGEPIYINGQDEDGLRLSVTARHLYEDGSDAPLFLKIIEQLPTKKSGDPIIIIEEVGTKAQCPERRPA